MERISLLSETPGGLHEHRNEHAETLSVRRGSAARGVTARGLCSGFLFSAQRFPRRPAVLAEGKALSYEELLETACRIAATIQKYPTDSANQLTGVFAYRSATAFAGVLGALLAGNGYVPL